MRSLHGDREVDLPAAGGYFQLGLAVVQRRQATQFVKTGNRGVTGLKMAMPGDLSFKAVRSHAQDYDSLERLRSGQRQRSWQDAQGDNLPGQRRRCLGGVLGNDESRRLVG